MTKHKVYVIWSNPIFRDSMRMVLTHPDIEWIGSELDIGQAIHEISELGLDTIIVEITADHKISELIKGLEKQENRLQIIAMSMESNNVTLYKRDNICVIHEHELLDIILPQSEQGEPNED